MAEPRWIRFEPCTPARGAVTKAWLVTNRESGGSLGMVRWYGGFRCYAFYPYGDTVYERTCLRDIADFCERMTQEHRAARTAG